MFRLYRLKVDFYGDLPITCIIDARIYIFFFQVGTGKE